MTGRGHAPRNEATAYGDSMAPLYDGYLEAVAKGARRDVRGGTPDPEAEVSFLADLAGGGGSWSSASGPAASPCRCAPRGRGARDRDLSRHGRGAESEARRR